MRRIIGEECALDSLGTVQPVWSTASAQSRKCGACGKQGAAKVSFFRAAGFILQGLVLDFQGIGM